MTASDTAGVSILSALLKRLAERGSVQISDFAAEQGFARATTFMVSRRLRESGYIVADAERGLAPGPAMRQFAWAAFGLPELAGPAEAVMRWLLEQTDGQVLLSVNGTAVIELGEIAHKTGDGRIVELERVLRDGKVGRAASLTLRLSSPQREQTVFAQLCLERAALTLEGYGRQPD